MSPWVQIPPPPRDEQWGRPLTWMTGRGPSSCWDSVTAGCPPLPTASSGRAGARPPGPRVRCLYRSEVAWISLLAALAGGVIALGSALLVERRRARREAVSEWDRKWRELYSRFLAAHAQAGSDLPPVRPSRCSAPSDGNPGGRPGGRSWWLPGRPRSGRTARHFRASALARKLFPPRCSASRSVRRGGGQGVAPLRPGSVPERREEDVGPGFRFGNPGRPSSGDGVNVSAGAKEGLPAVRAEAVEECHPALRAYEEVPGGRITWSSGGAGRLLERPMPGTLGVPRRRWTGRAPCGHHSWGEAMRVHAGPGDSRPPPSALSRWRQRPWPNVCLTLPSRELRTPPAGAGAALPCELPCEVP